MAGDWIKAEKVTPRKPEVLRIASKLGIHPDHAFGLCFRFWCWCDDNLNSCNAVGVTDVMLDALLDRDGIATALIEVGWLQVRNGSLVVPNFDRHLSESAKKRGLSAKRTADSRSRKCNAENVTKVLPEKRREEKSIEKEKTRGEEFQNCWRRWKQHLGQLQKPISSITEEMQLMELGRVFPVDSDAIAAIEYSILVQAKNLILNGDHAKPAKRPKPKGHNISDDELFSKVRQI
jgi:hypothetical protein